MSKDSHLIPISVSDIIGYMRKLPSSITICLWGQPGIGKTDAVKQAYPEPEYKTYCVLAGCSDPTDMGGLPDRHPGGGYFEHLPPRWAYLASTDCKEYQGPLIIFFDDFVTGDTQTQAALYKATHERFVGPCKFRDNVRIILAGNRQEDKSGVQDMPMALGSRMIQFSIEPDFEEWMRWAIINNIHPVIRSYLRTAPEDLNTFSKAAKNNVKVYAVPRSWHLLSDAFAAWGDHVDDESMAVLASGMVGQGISLKLCAHARVALNMIPPDEIVKNPETAKIFSESEIDLLYATAAALESYIFKHVTIPNVDAALRYSLRLNEEIGVRVAKNVYEIFAKSDKFTADQKAEYIISQNSAYAMIPKKWSFLS